MLERSNFFLGHPTYFFADWCILISSVGNQDDPICQEILKSEESKCCCL